jgi:hypothetical protein
MSKKIKRFVSYLSFISNNLRFDDDLMFYKITLDEYYNFD